MARPANDPSFIPARDSSGLAPIYDQLVAEQGNVPAEARRLAEEVQREAAQALDWSRLHPGG
ncbi:hypothetical protein AB0E27_06595 [Streptomyces sparsogenes]|uniref:hypothetical protein n=1 Tax=Streptomyces sparsogenes TaxID=67365 RepID=UPI0033C268E3